MKISKTASYQDFNLNTLKIGSINIATIQSLFIIAIAILYYWNNDTSFNLFTLSSHLQTVLLTLIPTIGYISLMKATNSQPKAWHIALLFSILIAIILSHNGQVHAQILDDVEGAIGDVGTAAGGNIATDILDAVIQIIRIAVYIAVAGAVIASIIFGVTQGQWQAPVLVVGVIIAVGLFLELMGVAVFG